MAEEFKLGQSNYSYGLYLNERNSKWYISEETIKIALEKINWDLEDLEKEYIKTWISLERIHRAFCFGEISEEEYDNNIANNYKLFYDNTGFEFGENCEKIETFLFSYFE